MIDTGLIRVRADERGYASFSEVVQLIDHIAELEKDAAIGKLAKKAFQELQDSPISFMKTMGRAIDTAMEASNA